MCAFVVLFLCKFGGKLLCNTFLSNNADDIPTRSCCLSVLSSRNRSGFGGNGSSGKFLRKSDLVLCTVLQNTNTHTLRSIRGKASEAGCFVTVQSWQSFPRCGERERASESERVVKSCNHSCCCCCTRHRCTFLFASLESLPWRTNHLSVLFIAVLLVVLEGSKKKETY